MSEVSSTSSAPIQKGILGLGKGTSAQLSDELLDKLKAADTRAQVDPISKTITKNKERQEDLRALNVLLGNLESRVSALSNESLYLQRKVLSHGKSATVSAVAGVSLQDLDINVKQLAKKDSYQSEKFKTSTNLIGATADGSFKIKIRGVSYQIDVSKSSTLQDLADKINEKAPLDLQARVINTGGEKPYQLILQSAATGSEQKITFEDDTAGVLDKLGWDDKVPTSGGVSNLEKNRLTAAQDAVFEYNGLSITRPKNTIDDLRQGISITLKETGISNFSVVQDTDGIAKSLEEMVRHYNVLVTNLNLSTGFDDKTKESGSFQGVSEVTSIRGELNRILSTQYEKGNTLIGSKDATGKVRNGLGIYVDELGENGTKGDYALDITRLNEVLAKDPSVIKDFFSGKTTVDSVIYNSKNTVQAGSLELKDDDLVINGVSIKLEKTDASKTDKENAIALLDAINRAGIYGVNASLDSAGTKLVLKSTDGTTIDVKAKNGAVSGFGLESSTLIPKTEHKKGLFTKIDSYIKDLTKYEHGTLYHYDKKLIDEEKKTTSEKEKIEESLNKKYETMRERWSLYASQISRLEGQFATLKSMIDFELSKK